MTDPYAASRLYRNVSSDEEDDHGVDFEAVSGARQPTPEDDDGSQKSKRSVGTSNTSSLDPASHDEDEDSADSVKGDEEDDEDEDSVAAMAARLDDSSVITTGTLPSVATTSTTRTGRTTRTGTTTRNSSVAAATTASNLFYARENLEAMAARLDNASVITTGTAQSVRSFATARTGISNHSLEAATTASNLYRACERKDRREQQQQQQRQKQGREETPPDPSVTSSKQVSSRGRSGEPRDPSVQGADPEGDLCDEYGPVPPPPPPVDVQFEDREEVHCPSDESGGGSVVSDILDDEEDWEEASDMHGYEHRVDDGYLRSVERTPKHWPGSDATGSEKQVLPSRSVSITYSTSGSEDDDKSSSSGVDEEMGERRAYGVTVKQYLRAVHEHRAHQAMEEENQKRCIRRSGIVLVAVVVVGAAVGLGMGLS